MGKRLLSFALVLALCAGVVPAAFASGEPGTDNAGQPEIAENLSPAEEAVPDKEDRGGSDGADMEGDGNSVVDTSSGDVPDDPAESPVPAEENGELPAEDGESEEGTETSALSGISGASVPSGAQEWNGHYYYVYDVLDPTLNRDEAFWAAEEYCESLGGHLATITSEEENDFLFQMMVNQGYESAYFGLIEVETDVWEWVTGERVTYTNWAAGEPNNEGGNENYGMFYWKYKSGQWNDGNFNAGTTSGDNVFICEWDDGDYGTGTGSGTVGSETSWSYLDDVYRMFTQYQKTIDYLCEDSNFPNSIYVYENDSGIGSGIAKGLSDLIYRGIDGWKELFTQETSIEDAEQILAALLETYQSDCQALSTAKTAEKYSKYFVDALAKTIEKYNINEILSDDDMAILNDVMGSEKVWEILESGDGGQIDLIRELADLYGLSESSPVYEMLDWLMTSNELMETVSSGLEFLGTGLELLSVTEDTFNYFYQLESLCTADEMYLEMLQYLRDNCGYDVVRQAAGNLYDVIEGSYKEQIQYVTGAITDKLEETVVDAVIDTALKSLPMGTILQKGFDWGAKISNAVFSTGDTQEQKDTMRSLACTNTTLSDWVSESMENFNTAYSQGDMESAENYARSAYYGLYMLRESREAGEEALQGMLDLLGKDTDNKWYATSEMVQTTLEAMENTLFSLENQELLLSVAVDCPVDVEVYDTGGNLIFTVRDGAESVGYDSSRNIYYKVTYNGTTGEYIKVLCLAEDCGYALKYVGLGTGNVSCIIATANTDGTSRYYLFEDLDVDADTVITTVLSASDSYSYVVTDTRTGDSAEGKYLTDGDHVPDTKDKTDYMPGDINGDGSVNISDVQILLKYVNKQDVEGQIIPDACDCDGSGTVNISDVQILLKYVNKQDVTVY